MKKSLEEFRKESREHHMKAYELNLKNGNKHEAMTELWMADLYQLENPIESAKLNVKTVDLSDVFCGKNFEEIYTYLHIYSMHKLMQGYIEAKKQQDTSVKGDN